MVKSVGNKNKKLSPFEDALDLTTLVRLKKSGYVIGAYLLSKKQVGDTNNTGATRFSEVGQKRVIMLRPVGGDR